MLPANSSRSEVVKVSIYFSAYLPPVNGKATFISSISISLFLFSVLVDFWDSSGVPKDDNFNPVNGFSLKLSKFVLNFSASLLDIVF